MQIDKNALIDKTNLYFCPKFYYYNESILNLRKDFYKNHKCDKCKRRYFNKNSLIRHNKFECGISPNLKCDNCGKKYKRKYALKCHLKNCDILI